MLAEALLCGKRVVPVRSGENVLDPTLTAIGIERCDHLEAVRARMGTYRLPWLGTSARGDVVAPDRLLDEAMTVADLIAANPLECVMEGKRMVHRHMVEQDVDAVVAEENRTFAHIQKGPAHKEFVRAFIEKREPHFNQA